MFVDPKTGKVVEDEPAKKKKTIPHKWDRPKWAEFADELRFVVYFGLSPEQRDLEFCRAYADIYREYFNSLRGSTLYTPIVVSVTY